MADESPEQRVDELEEEVEELRETVQKMMPSRRDVLKMSGAAAAGAAGVYGATGGASAGTDQAGTAGSPSHLRDLYVEDIKDGGDNIAMSFPGDGSVNIDDVDINTTLMAVKRESWDIETWWDSIDGFQQLTNGSASTSILTGPSLARIDTGSTADSDVYLRKTVDPIFNAASWDDYVAVRVGIEELNSVNENMRAIVGSDGFTGDNSKKVGVSVANGDLNAYVGDGSTLTEQALLSGIATDNRYDVLIQHFPGNKVSFTVSGAGSATTDITSNIPSGAFTDAIRGGPQLIGSNRPNGNRATLDCFYFRVVHGA